MSFESLIFIIETFDILKYFQLMVETAQINDVLRVIYERRAVRKYRPEPVNKQLIEEIISAGRMAPSAINLQPWKFYVVTDRELIRAFSREIAVVAKDFFHLSHWIDLPSSKDFIFHEAPVVIFITSPKDNEWASLDVGMCAQNMMLAAKAMELDTCPIGLAKFVEQTRIFSRLNIPQSEKVQLAIIIGYGDETPEVKQRATDNVTYIQ